MRVKLARPMRDKSVKGPALVKGGSRRAPWRWTDYDVARRTFLLVTNFLTFTRWAMEVHIWLSGIVCWYQKLETQKQIREKWERDWELGLKPRADSIWAQMTLALSILLSWVKLLEFTAFTWGYNHFLVLHVNHYGFGIRYANYSTFF